MDIYTELLPPSFTVKVDSSFKEQPKNHQQLRAKKVTKESIDSSQHNDVDEQTDPCIKERRCGDDRRKGDNSRGPWFESRAKHDRREQGLLLKV